MSLCQGDCDDNDSLVNPDAPEACNQKDDNCDGSTDEGCDCIDGEHRPCGSDTGECEPGVQDCQGGRWSECKGGVEAQAESCNGKDDDCDGNLSDDEQDTDGDGQMPCSGDCDDDDLSVFTGAPEVCDGKDNDCDGKTDEDCVQPGIDAGVVDDGEIVLTGGCSCGGVSPGYHGAWWFLVMGLFLVQLKLRR